MDTSNGIVRTRLQHATAGIHERLHRQPQFVRLMAGDLTKLEYSALLGRLYGFHWPLEVRLRAVPTGLIGKPAPSDPTIRETAHLLRADLVHLGVSEPEIHAIPLCEALPVIESPEELVGCLYVIEGAGLGGRVMAWKLDHLLGDQDRAGRQFLLGGPELDSMHWRRFCRWLEAWAEQRDIPAIIGSACRTFESMERWLSSEHGNV